MTEQLDRQGTMWFLPDLSSRSQEPGLMDLADSSQEQLFSTLEQFGIINRLLTPCHRLMKHFLCLGVIQHVCRLRYVLSDIRRSYSTYITYTAIAGPCFKNSFAYYDGRLSIRKGFTRKECISFIEMAELSDRVRVYRAFPSHLALVNE